MNKNEKKYLQTICMQVSMKENFNNIREKIQIEKDTNGSSKNIYSLLLKILMPCEIIAFCICLGLFFVIRMKPLPEGGVQNNIEVIYLTLCIVFAFIFLITLIVHHLLSNRKGGTKSET